MLFFWGGVFLGRCSFLGWTCWLIVVGRDVVLLRFSLLLISDKNVDVDQRKRGPPNWYWKNLAAVGGAYFFAGVSYKRLFLYFKERERENISFCYVNISLTSRFFLANRRQKPAPKKRKGSKDGQKATTAHATQGFKRARTPTEDESQRPKREESERFKYLKHTP